MKLAFIFNTKFSNYQEQYYTFNLTKEFYQKRYLNYVDELVIIGRSNVVDTPPKGKPLVSPKIQFRCIPEQSQLKRLFYLQQEHEFIKQAIADCDVVICRGWWGTRACRELHKKYMIEVISDAWDAYWNHSWLGKLLAVPIYLLTKKTIREAPYVLYVTTQYLQQRYPTDGKQVGVSDVELFDKPDAQLLAQRIKRIKTGKIPLILGTAAAVDVKYKGQANVIKALAILKKQGKIFQYQLVGGGNSTRLKNLAERLGVAEQVKFLGLIPHSQIFDWYDKIDIYIQPSLQEGLPRAVVEAMSRALPCIGAKTGGIPELIDPSCIYMTGWNMPNKIVKQLLQFTPEKMAQEATRNFERAKDFQEEKLAAIRNHFMEKFIKSNF